MVFHLRLILIGERFIHNFQSLEIIGDMYQYTEAFCHYIREILRKAKKSSSSTFQHLEKKPRKIWKIGKLREKNVDNSEKEALR